MKITNHSGSAKRLKLFLAVAIADLLFNPASMHAQALSGSTLTITGSTTLEGNVSVTGTAATTLGGNLSVTGTGSVVDFYGDILALGTVTSGSTGEAGLTAVYTDGATPTFTLTTTRPLPKWSWGYFASGTSTIPTSQMTLDPVNGLAIYNNSGVATVFLNPAGVTGTTSLLTQQAAASEFVSGTNFTVTSTSGHPNVALTGGSASGGGSFAGLGATASGSYSTASGRGSTASGNDSTAIGPWTTASGAGAIAIGPCSGASGSDSTAIGGAWAGGNESTAIGPWASASGYFSTAIGYGSSASGYGSTASGCYVLAAGRGSTASGFVSTAGGPDSTASGAFSLASGIGSTASGYRSTAAGNFSTASGLYSTASGYGQFVAGVNNIPQGSGSSWVPTDDLFIIGNGRGPSGGETKSDALVVQKNGNTTVYGDLTVSGTTGGPVLSLGTVTSGSTVGQPGVNEVYTDGTTSTFSFVENRTTAPKWYWGYLGTTGTNPQMTLDPVNGLTIYNNSGAPAIFLNPAWVTGTTSLLTQQAAASEFVSDTNFIAGSIYGQPTVALTGGASTGGYSLAGIQATASGQYSTAIGCRSAAGYESTAIGYESYAGAQGATAVAPHSSASGAESTASGYGSTASKSGATASGFESVASGVGSSASGVMSTAGGFDSNASGGFSLASGAGSTASGYHSIANGNYSLASNYLSYASGIYSSAVGPWSTSIGCWSIAAGATTTASSYGQFVIGEFNVIPQTSSSNSWVLTDELFTIGNGTSQTSPSDAFVVKKNGDTTISGALVVNGTTGNSNTIGNGGLALSGTAVTSGPITTVVATGNNLVLIPQQGDLSMGAFVAGSQPPQQ